MIRIDIPASVVTTAIIALVCCIPIFGYVAVRSERDAGPHRWTDERYRAVWMIVFIVLTLLGLALLLPPLLGWTS